MQVFVCLISGNLSLGRTVLVSDPHIDINELKPANIRTMYHKINKLCNETCELWASVNRGYEKAQAVVTKLHNT